MSSTIDRTRVSVRIAGLTQGVGFRPFVHRLAGACGIAGHVGNDGLGVFCQAEGSEDAVAEFLRRLRCEQPPGAIVEQVQVERVPATGDSAFLIVASNPSAPIATTAPPDRALCGQCRAELADPANRRFGHALIACADCGPRYSMVTGVPYDRDHTTMAKYSLCPACQTEYDDPRDRRFHAQPIACPDCGPRLRFTADTAEKTGDPEAISAARAVLASGGVLAVKGIGGYHLACDASDAAVVERLRVRKHRGPKPFAVMVRDLATAERLGQLSETARGILQSAAAPIALVRPTAEGLAIAAAVAPGATESAPGLLGLLLPYTGLQVLLLDSNGDDDYPDSLVMTSANLADEPLCTDADEAEERLNGIADAFLHHDREVVVGCDDSVVRLDGAQPIPIRRSRGVAPLPIRLPVRTDPVLAVGGELKATVCLATGHRAVLSQHLGDVASWETAQNLSHTVDHLERITGIRAERLVADLHPGYLSRRWAERAAIERGVQLDLVQHHHAHLAALLAEHNWTAGPVLGFVFDGTGFGHDETIWGGELLLGDLAKVDRVGHLRPIQLPGGDAAIRRPSRTALAHLHAAGLPWQNLPPLTASEDAEVDLLRQMLDTGAGCTPTSSIGRLFDAVSSLLGVCHEAGYEGHAAVALEALAALAARPADLTFEVTEGDRVLLDPTPVLSGAIAELLSGRPAADLAAGFHAALSDAVGQAALLVRARHGVETIGLTGGVFQNALLLRSCAEQLRDIGFTVLTHREVPSNDGGLALGQAAVVAAGGGS